MNAKVRNRFTLLASIVLALVALIATFYKQETTAVTALTGIMTILSTHIWINKKSKNDD